MIVREVPMWYNFSALLISIIIGGVVYSELWRLWYLMPGAYGSFFGIIAGPLGICASNSKRLSTTKCLWTSHIALVSWISMIKFIGHFNWLVQCVVTIIGSILGFSFGVIGLMDTAYEILGYYGGCRSYLCTQMFAFMAIETFLSFGKLQI